MARTKRVAGAAALVVVATVVTGCGDDDDPFDAYCQEVEAQQDDLSEDLAGGGATALIDALPSFERLADEAPEDLRDEWATVTTRIEGLVEALEAADVDPATYDRDDPPAGLTPEDKTAIDAAARALATPEMTRALSGVEQQARDVCKTPLAF